MSTFVVGPDTVERQRRASDPRASVWVSANAGAGKTKVLTDRVIRLLLEGVAPSRVLCLTFTKAAAAEMTIRIGKRLGAWVTLEDEALAAELEGLTGRRPKAPDRARARRLFARAVETPGGLKIETLHAFCERVLHLVPLEAGVPATFQVLDEAQSRDLLGEARGAVLAAAASGGREQHTLGPALSTVAAEVSGDALSALLDAAALDERLPGDSEALAGALVRLRTAFGLAPGDTPDALALAILEGGPAAAGREALAATLAASAAKGDQEQAERLRGAGDGGGGLEARLESYLSVFLTDKGAVRKSFCTRKMGETVAATLAVEAERVLTLREGWLASRTVERTAALMTLALAVRSRVDGIKARLGALDFDDLIDRTLALLDRGIAPWVLYRLDRGVDHVLVDEAQDTSPKQWAILKSLTEEFTAGAGKPSRGARTVFAVGDPKQSIYSFQGADPREFETSRRHWDVRSRQAKLDFHDIRLDLSFRSAQPVLDAVDRTFGVEAHYRGLSFADDAIGTSHYSARPGAPGHVEIWPTELPEEREEPPDAWSRPLDAQGRGAPSWRAANAVARAVRAWTREGDAYGRVWRPEEILVLSSRRGPAFFAAIGALREAGVPVAGADRLEIGAHIAVADLVAAGGAALLPGHDLVLAAALKSPLVGLDDDDLIRVAADRGEAESLADALARLAPDDPAAGRGHAALTLWRGLALAHGPFGFYARLLGPEGGRRRLVERLGGEAADAVDAFLAEAAAAEGGPETATLTTFLARFETTTHSVKRDLEAAGGEVRVMTVHGSKGLEAPLVILLDGCEVMGREPTLLPVSSGGGPPVLAWSPRAATDGQVLSEARAAAAALRLEEHNRLLYVAMTRAADALVIAPYASRRRREPRAEAWCEMVRRGFAEAEPGLVTVARDWGDVEVFRREGTASRPAAPARPAGPAEALPDWLTRAVDPEPPVPPSPLAPSAALAALAGAATGADPETPPARARQAARLRGSLVHALIEALAPLPPGERQAQASRLLRARAAGLAEEFRAEVAAAALAVLDEPRLALLFGPGSRAEAALAGSVRLPSGGFRAVEGRVDRLAVTAEAVWLADFKTGRAPSGSSPAAYVAQLALYRELLRVIWPGRPVRCLLVWTQGPDIREASAGELDAALACIP